MPMKMQVTMTHSSMNGWVNIQTERPRIRTTGRQAALEIMISFPLFIEAYPIGKDATNPEKMMRAAETPARVSL